MALATQLLAYHGRTALLLGPMPRRAIPMVANIPAPIRPLVDVSDLARNTTLKAAAGLGQMVRHRLLETTVLPMPGAASGFVRNGDCAATGKPGMRKTQPKDGRRGQG